MGLNTFKNPKSFVEAFRLEIIGRCSNKNVDIKFSAHNVFLE